MKKEEAVEKKRILLVDDHPIVRQGLSQLINREPDLVVCGEAGDRQEAFRAIETLRPDLVLLDLSLKDDDGLQIMKELRTMHPRLLVLMISMHNEMMYADRALRAGAKGYITKQETTANMMDAIRKIIAGQIYVTPRVQEKIIASFVVGGTPKVQSPVENLTDRELEVLRLIGSGLGNRDIAEKLHLSVKTIEAHRENIKLKLGLKNATALMQFAVEWAARRSR